MGMASRLRHPLLVNSCSPNAMQFKKWQELGITQNLVSSLPRDAHMLPDVLHEKLRPLDGRKRAEFLSLVPRAMNLAVAVGGLTSWQDYSLRGMVFGKFNRLMAHDAFSEALLVTLEDLMPYSTGKRLYDLFNAMGNILSSPKIGTAQGQPQLYDVLIAMAWITANTPENDMFRPRRPDSKQNTVIASLEVLEGLMKLPGFDSRALENAKIWAQNSQGAEITFRLVNMRTLLW
jgi:hypothetical protein